MAEDSWPKTDYRKEEFPMSYSQTSHTPTMLIRLGGLVLMLVLINAMLSLGAIRYTNEQLLQDTAKLEALESARDHAQSASIHFKRQVQEWKNVLLRGHDPQDLDRYQHAFEQEFTEVQRAFEQLAAQAPAAGLSELPITEAAADHRVIKQDYDEALAAFRADDGKNPRAVDTRLRGIDRELTATIDRIDAISLTKTKAMRQEIAAAAAARFDQMFRLILFANLIAATLVIVLMLTSLRAMRQRP
jgi:hypothetical protein